VKYNDLSVVLQKPECITMDCSWKGKRWQNQAADAWSFSWHCGWKRPHNFSPCSSN